ncbi:MAG: dihydroorotase [Deltaproteobacteria bacterium]|nr:dihydroorotase [Deltaproteobacteria bacterium]MBK8715859.1 dihydroorotase [Deltaproteobacteria bacterium]MBP7286589.1 dihydroorotase [Nannocystaceae bacterium]
MDRIELPRPDDWHLHLRDGDVLPELVRHSARFGRAIVMPNLRPPVTAVAGARAYRERILAARPPGSDFEPLMTLYLTAATTTAEIDAAAADPFVHAIKLYPAGATTNADAGVRDVLACDEVLRAMAAVGLPLLVHGESIDPQVDVFDREAVFVRETLARVIDRHPTLPIVLEHVSTAEAVAFVEAAPAHVAATITAHHLLFDRNAMFKGGLRPHMYCLPVLKRAHHREALVRAATSGSPKFFLGTDSAPHGRGAKQAPCGCAGVFTAHAALELYAEAFDAAGALPRLPDFASRFGPAFYRLPVATSRVTLVREPWRVPASYRLGDDELVPLRADELVQWRWLP